MTDKTTPGPWKAVPDPNCRGGFQVVTPEYVLADRLPKDVAYLIAAAPAMREALGMVVDLGDSWGRRYSLMIDYIDEIIEAARVAPKLAEAGDE